MKTKHTPIRSTETIGTPYELSLDGKRLLDKTQSFVANFECESAFDVNDKRAKFITLACNHHEELVAQLEAVTERLGAWMTIADPDDVTDEDKQTLASSRSILTKLKG